ncbi:hypothetical protein KEG57_44870 [Polyangium jinanense]|uniref:Uncharacterized protein n=1 Tax=Polyangium jinanense TaxID=2829994 RepID=A0A9X4AZ13_9BACT|nr:hypothetical protein [Polyangium jinanense]
MPRDLHGGRAEGHESKGLRVGPPEHLAPEFGELPLDKVDGKAAADLDLDLSRQKLTRSTRNNTQIVLRPVLRFAKSRGYVEDRPVNLPKLEPIGQSILEIPSDDQVPS